MNATEQMNELLAANADSVHYHLEQSAYALEALANAIAGATNQHIRVVHDGAEGLSELHNMVSSLIVGSNKVIREAIENIESTPKLVD